MEQLNKQNNQPQIIIEDNNTTNQTHYQQHNSQQTINSNNNKNNNPQNNNNNAHDEEYKKSMQMIQQIRLKHPQCIPVFYVKHQASPKQFPSPKIPFILFKKQLKIQQAMYNLYSQIEIKGLYFFCTRYDQKQKKMKYVIIKPGETIQQIYNKYGRNGHLVLIYGDKNIGMGGINKAQKWLIRVLIVLVGFWVFLFAQPVYYAYTEGGLPAVWDTIELMWNRNQRQQNTNKQSKTINETLSPTDQKQQDSTLAKQQSNNEQVVFTQKDIPTNFQQNHQQQQTQSQTLL